MTLPQGYYETNNTPQAIRDLYTMNEDTGEYERVTGGSSAVGGDVNQGDAGTDPWLITGSVNVGNFPTTQAVSGPLTNTQLRAAAVPVAAEVSNWPASQNVVVTSAPWRKLPLEINHSGTITTADTWQIVVPLNENRTEFSMQLLTDNAELWVTPFYTAGMVAGSPGTWRLQAGNTYWAKGRNEIRVLSSTAGAVYTASEAE